MFALKCFSFSNNVLGSRNILCLRNTLACCKKQQALLSGKTYEKLGIPHPPKRPAIPYIKFLQRVRPSVLQRQPNLSPPDVVKVIAQEWHQCDAEKKKLLQKEYLSEMQIYIENCEKYKQKITPQQKTLINNFKLKRKQAKDAARLNEKKESLGKPKRPLTAFVRFMMESKSQRDDNLKFSEWMKDIGKQWENMSDKDKEKYVTQSKIDLEKYKTNLLNWEEGMIRQGHTDVVRNADLFDAKSKKRQSPKSAK